MITEKFKKVLGLLVLVIFSIGIIIVAYFKIYNDYYNNKSNNYNIINAKQARELLPSSKKAREISVNRQIDDISNDINFWSKYGHSNYTIRNTELHKETINILIDNGYEVLDDVFAIENDTIWRNYIIKW